MSGGHAIDRAFAALDRGGDLVRNNWGSVGLLWLLAIPTRLLLIDLVIDIHRLGAAASSHGDALLGRSRWVFLTWLLSLLGRQAFVRACRAQMGGEPLAGWRRFVAPPRDMLAHAQSALVIEALFWALAPFVVAMPPLLILAGLSAVASPLEGPGWVRSIRALAVVGRVGPVLVVGLGMLVALLLMALNLHVLAQGLHWLASGVSGWDLAAWDRILDLQDNSLYLALVLCGATLLVEPFWLASLVVLVQESRARSSGEDLRDRLMLLPQEDLPTDEPTAEATPSPARASA